MMKRILLFTLLISFIGYSQNPIQPNTPNFEDGIPQDLVEKIKPINLEFGDDEMMDFNPNQNNNKINSQSFESSGMVQNENDYNLKLDSLIKVGIDSYGVSHKTISKFDENNNKVYEELFFWDSNNTYFEPIEIREFIYDMEGYLNQENVFYWDLNSQSYNLNWKGDYEYDENSNQTLLLTMRAIMDFQKQYFLSGDESKLKPMILKDIAEKIQMDISTISRVANSKYVDCPYGIKLIKSFFSEGITNDKGVEVSTIEIKKELRIIIENEDKLKPLTDDQLTKLINQKGYPIARRTVAKYREMIGCPVARLRKKL